MASIRKQSRDKGQKNKPYYVQYMNEDGKRVTVKGFTDKALTEQLAAKLEHEVMLRKRGMIDPAQERLLAVKQSPIADALGAFERSLDETTPKHRKLTMTRVRRLIEAGVADSTPLLQWSCSAGAERPGLPSVAQQAIAEHPPRRVSYAGSTTVGTYERPSDHVLLAPGWGASDPTFVRVVPADLKGWGAAPSAEPYFAGQAARYPAGGAEWFASTAVYDAALGERLSQDPAALGVMRRVVTALFRRPMAHVSLGVVAGSVLIAVAAIAVQYTEEFSGIQPRGLTLGEIAMLVGYAVLMLGVCALACIVPSLRALRVQPMEALRAD